MASANKKGFDYRMSKKVAELTQVVHMLFTKNHEKEVEIESLKEAYEHEIEEVQKDAKAQIGDLKKKIEEMKNTLSSQPSQSQIEEDQKKKEDEWKRKVNDLEGRLQEEKKECQSVRDLLIQAQKDLENLRLAHDGDLNAWNNDAEAQNQEINKLKMQVNNLERRLKESDSQSNGAIQELQRAHNRLQKEMTHSRGAYHDNEKMKEQLMLRNKQLENDVRLLKKELGRKERRDSVTSTMEVKETRDANVTDYLEEIERLRREVQRYKNELTNRESNFNRMFVEQSPMLVKQRTNRMSSSSSSMGDSPIHFRYSRERSAVSSGRASIEADDIASMMATRVVSGRLPHLERDQRGKPQVQLTKPKPLPRELLTSKVIGRA